MACSTRRVLIFVSLLSAYPSLAAADPPPAEVEQLPAPRAAVTMVPAFPPGVPMFHVPQRINYEERWQAYGVDAYGRFRPRVVYSPYQPYYYFNGKPYYLAPVQPRAFMSSVVGQ